MNNALLLSQHKNKFKLLTIVVAVLLVVWRYQNFKGDFEKATDFISGYHDLVTSRVSAALDSILADVSYESMISRVSSVVSAFEGDISQVPPLLNTETDTLVGNLEGSIDASVEPVLRSIEAEGAKKLEETIPVTLTRILGEVDDEFRAITEDLVDSDDVQSMLSYYETMTSEMRERFVSEISAKFEKDFRARTTRVREFYGVNLSGVLFMYREFITSTKKMASDFTGDNQAENYVHSIAESKIAETVVNHVKYDLIPAYASGEFTEEQLESFLVEFFVEARVIRDFMEEELTFRSENGHVPSILENRASQLYLNAFDRNSSNKIMSEDQIRSLNAMAKDLFEDLSEYLRNSGSVQNYTLPVLKGFSDAYLFSILPRIYTYVFALFVEFRNVLTRARLEGSQTCTLQFFELRRVLDHEFFFALSQENGFDLGVTETRYRELYADQISSARDRMIGYARLPYIVYLYDDSLDFLGVSSELLFFSDVSLRSVVDEVTASFHDRLADSITDSLDAGIEETFDEENDSSRVVVDAAFQVFRNNMEILKASHLVDEVSEVVSQEISEKVGFVSDLIPDLLDEFRGDVTDKFDNEWMEHTKQQFLTGDDVDLEGMKRFAVEEMNTHAGGVTTEYLDLVRTYIDAQITGINDTMAEISVHISEAIEASPITDESKETIRESLERVLEDTAGTISSVQTSLIVNVNDVLQGAIVSLDTIMDINTQNFFNTGIREVVEAFQASASSEFSGLYYEHIDKMSAAYKILSNDAKVVFEEHARALIGTEVLYRDRMSSEIKVILDGYGEEIVNDFDIVSYNARRTIILNNMRMRVLEGGLGTRVERNSKISANNRDYAMAVIQFRNKYQQVALDLMAAFNTEYASRVSSMYARHADVLSKVAPVLSVIEGSMRQSLSDAFSALVGQVVFQETNDLPSIDMVSISYPQGIMATSDAHDGDLPSVMREILMLPDIDNSGGAEYLDENQVASEVDQGLDTLGNTSSGGTIGHEDITLALSDYDAWETNIVEMVIEDLEETMTQQLKENTCPIKPTCKDGSGTCDRSVTGNLECREGYVLGVNSHGIPCCLFDPVAAGFPVGDIARLLGEELALMYFTSPQGVGHVAKLARFMSRGMGKVGGKVAGRFLAVSSKFSSKASGVFAKVGGRMGKKIAIRTGRKAGMKLATKVLASTAAKVAVKASTALAGVAAKAGAKAGASVAAKSAGKAVASAAFKSLAKAAAAGPVGIALLAFDILSLALDLWDPAGYNDAQAAGQIKGMRDSIETYYGEMLASEGITSPLLPDPMYNLDPSKRAEFTENLMMQWFADKMLEFTSANEERWQYMPSSEAAAEQNAEVVRLTDVIFTDPNFFEELTCANTENTFMVRASKINGTSRDIVGTSRDKDFDETTGKHLSICCLNATGVTAHNSFSHTKTEFINELVLDPLYRWVKISDEGGYKIYQDLTKSELSTATKEVERRQSIVEDGGSISDEELNAPAIIKFGWSLVKVEPEDEFWRQYNYSQENDTGMPERKNFHKAWEKDEEENAKNYEMIIEATMEENLAETVPCHEITGECEALVSLETIRKSSGDEDAPEWYPDYDDLRESSKKMVDDNIAERLEDELAHTRVNEALLADMNKGLDEQYAEDTGVTVEEAKRERIRSSLDTENNVQEADFAVFKNGFSQSSPLLSVKQTCDDMGYGVEFVSDKGLCEFTQEYCDRFGLTYFYNEDVGTHDCKLATSQRVFETIFGTTVTRSVKRGAKALGSVGPAGELIDLETDKRMSPMTMMSNLDQLGLGSKYSIW